MISLPYHELPIAELRYGHELAHCENNRILSMSESSNIARIALFARELFNYLQCFWLHLLQYVDSFASPQLQLAEPIPILCTTLQKFKQPRKDLFC